MAEFLLSVVVQELLNKAISLASSEIDLVQSSKKELIRLSETLTMIRAVLDDAQRRQVSEDAVKIWLKKLKDVAYEADNVLDEVGYEILRRKVEIQNQTKKKVRFFISSANPMVFRLGLSHKIKAINSSLKNVNQEANDFGLLRRIIIDINTPGKVHVQRESDSFVNYSEIIGRDDEVSEIVKLMIGSRDQEKLSVIPIVGMGGIGKTTLAKLLYNDERVKMNFDARVWVCVSHQFDVKRLLLEILESCREIKCEIRRRDDILGNLEKELKGKKYLLVLDDVWNEDIIAWEDFRSCLLGINTIMGNKIVVTTRSTRVGSIMGTHEAHHLEGLTDDSCWSIFKERAFAAGGAPMTRDLVDIGTEIARKCHGVPLAAMVMGSLMSSKREIQEWLAIRNSGVWSLEGEESGVLRVLKLSFDHLPSSSVKKCFSYCSIFPKDYDVEKNQIIQLWMAVGFLQSNHKGKVIEDIGEEFFSILVQNSLLQDIRKDKYNNITNCRMHDLVHDLALSVSGSEIFNSNATLGNDFAKARHLALYSGEEIMCEISKERARCLQTLFSSINVAKNLLVSFKCLRVLNFYAADIEELPNSVSKLVYLRYLDLSYTPIMVLPEGISKLYNLQTLRLNNCRSLKLKDELRNLVSLRHLYLPAYDHADVIMPFGIGRLTCLRTLKFYNVGEEKGRRIEELGSLKHLRGKLEIHNLQKVSSVKEAQSANLFEKADVQKLKFRWSWDRESFGNDEEVLEVLRPHHNLKSLTIEGFMGEKFPIWVMNMRVSVNVLDGLTMLDNLVKIKFLDCNRCDDIPVLGQLPLLRELEITRMNTVKCISASFYSDHINFNTNGSSTSPTVLFPELMTFRLTNMPNLEEWAEAATVPATTAVFPRTCSVNHP